MAEQMYSYKGKATPYSQLPYEIQKNVTKTQTYVKSKKYQDYVKKEQTRDSDALARAKGYASYKGMSAREIMKERERLYSQGHKAFAKTPFVMGNTSNVAGSPKAKNVAGYNKAVKSDMKRAGVTVGKVAVSNQLGRIVGTTWDQRMAQGNRYTVTNPTSGEQKTFNNKIQAEIYAKNIPVQQSMQQPSSDTKYSVVSNSGKTRVFKTLDKAEKYAATQTKTQSSFIGFGTDGTPIQGAPAPEYQTVVYPKAGDKYITTQGGLGTPLVEHTITEKPLSSTGTRLELIAGWLDQQQIQAVKDDKVSYYRDAYGIPQRQGGTNLIPMGIEVLKDVVAGAAYLENLVWAGEAAVRGGEKKTRDIIIPETATGVLTSAVIQGKSAPEIWKAGAQYEKTYGRGTVLAGGSAAFIPIPGMAGLNIVKSVKASPLAMKFISPVARKVEPVLAKLQVPKIKNVKAKFQDIIISSNQKRIVKQYAITRADEGIFGIKKLSRNVWSIERGVEEVVKPVSPILKKIQTGWTKTKGVIKPTFSKEPKNIIIPKQGKMSTVPLTIIEFGKEYTKRGSKLSEIVPKFEKIAGEKLPVLAKSPKKVVVKRVKPLSVKIKKSLGIGLGFGLPKKGLVKSITGSLGIGVKKSRPKAKKVTLTEVTDFMAVEKGQYQTVGTNRVLLTAADPDFIKQANRLKLEKISTSGYQGRISKELVEAEQIGLVKLSAIGKTIPMKLGKSGDIFGYIGKKTRLTKVFELGKGGLGKADFTIDVTKNKNILSIGSKDFTRKLEAVGLGTKRIITKGSFTDSSSIPTGLGRAGGGAASRLEASVKRNIISSFAKSETVSAKAVNVSLDKIKGATKYTPAGAGLIGGTVKESNTTDYFKTPDRYQGRSKVKSVFDNDTELINEYNMFELGKVAKASSDTYLIPKLGIGSSSRSLTRTETRLLGNQKQSLSLDVAPKIKTDILTKQIEKLDTKHDQFRIQLPKLREIERQKTIVEAKQTPKLKIDTPTRFKITSRLDTPTVTTTKLIPPVFPLPNIRARRKSKGKVEKTYSADFLGASSESSILGLTNRADITYGLEKTSRLSALDLKKRKKAGSSVNPENIKFKKRRKKVDKDPYKEQKKSRTIKSTKFSLFGGKKGKLKF